MSYQVSYLEAADGWFPRLCQSVVDPAHDGVVIHLLPVAQLLQDVQGVPEDRRVMMSLLQVMRSHGSDL